MSQIGTKPARSATNLGASAIDLLLVVVDVLRASPIHCNLFRTAPYNCLCGAWDTVDPWS